jgi:carbon monoxide dehydrogenase subunit G
MELTHSFTVPIGADEAMGVLTDIERIAPCMPGASIDSVDGDEFTGRVKVKVGPMQITYRGRARFTEVDREQHRAVIEARGQETRGSGTANATVHAHLEEGDGDTRVTVVTDLSVTGRPAQFGRGVMSDVGAKLLGQFADCLSSELGAQPSPAEAVTQEVPTVDEQRAPAAASPAHNGSAAGIGERDVARVAGIAQPQPPGGAELAAATPAPPADAADATTTASPTPEGPEAGRPDAQRPTRPTAEAIDLVDVAGASVAKRVGPVLAALAIVWLLVRLLRRRRANSTPSGDGTATD